MLCLDADGKMTQRLSWKKPEHRLEESKVRLLLGSVYCVRADPVPGPFELLSFGLQTRTTIPMRRRLLVEYVRVWSRFNHKPYFVDFWIILACVILSTFAPVNVCAWVQNYARLNIFCMRVCVYPRVHVRAVSIAETFCGLYTFVPDQHWSVRVFLGY
jgi:hypothetical protein